LVSSKPALLSKSNTLSKEGHLLQFKMPEKCAESALKIHYVCQITEW